MKKMKRIFVPTENTDDWFSPERKLQCKQGNSAKALADQWEAAGGLPDEVKRLFVDSGYPEFEGIELILAIPEYQVALPGSDTAPSCNDLFVLARGQGGLISIAIEGKVSESFGDPLGDWCKDSTVGRKDRLAFLKQTIGLNGDIPNHIYYQLLHRTASAVLEARRFGAPLAVMLVQSFSKEDKSLGDYKEFVSLYRVAADKGQIVRAADLGDVILYFGWVYGDIPERQA